MGNLVWIASYPKSGNTWLRAFLHNLLRAGDEARRASYDINRLTDLCQSEAATKWFAQFDSRPVEAWSDADIMANRAKVHLALTRLMPDSIFVKTHNAMVSYRGHPAITDSATGGALYVVRNPLDVVISFADHNGWTIDQAIRVMAARYVKPTTPRNVTEIYGSWSENVESWTRHAGRHLHVVRYEDLLDQPLKTFGGIAGFLGLPPSRQRLEQAIKASSFKVLQAQEKAKGFIEKSEPSERFFRVGKAGQWRKILTPGQVEQIVDTHREQMARFGYLPTSAA